MVSKSVGCFTDPYKWGIPWGYITHLLTIDPITSLGHPRFWSCHLSHQTALTDCCPVAVQTQTTEGHDL